DPPIGYAVAVSQRTERIEPPLILGSRTLGDEWEVVVARHSEESLAFSNRPLFGRLGWHGVALSFERDYRTPDWPSRLEIPIDDVGGPPTPNMHPAKPVDTGRTRPESAKPAIGHVVLGDIANYFPSLWKGADIYRFGRLPHYYRVTVLAAARAG